MGAQRQRGRRRLQVSAGGGVGGERKSGERKIAKFGSPRWERGRERARARTRAHTDVSWNGAGGGPALTDYRRVASRRRRESHRDGPVRTAGGGRPGGRARAPERERAPFPLYSRTLLSPPLCALSLSFPLSLSWCVCIEERSWGRIASGVNERCRTYSSVQHAMPLRAHSGLLARGEGGGSWKKIGAKKAVPCGDLFTHVLSPEVIARIFGFLRGTIVEIDGNTELSAVVLSF